MDLRSLIPAAPLLLRPLLTHVLNRFEALEKRIEALEQRKP